MREVKMRRTHCNLTPMAPLHNPTPAGVAAGGGTGKEHRGSARDISDIDHEQHQLRLASRDIQGANASQMSQATDLALKPCAGPLNSAALASPRHIPLQLGLGRITPPFWGAT